MIYPIEEGQIVGNDNPTRTCFGHSGLGGSIALCDACATTGDIISIAITTNRLVLDSKPTRKILRAVYKDVLRIPAPLPFIEKDGNKENDKTRRKKGEGLGTQSTKVQMQ